MSIVYKKGSLFSALENSILVHSCNAKGVWGAGIAKEMAKRFPAAYEDYRNMVHNGSIDIGEALISTDKDYEIGSLVVSKGYGKFKDSKDDILKNTKLALEDFFSFVMGDDNINSNKFNSGLFGVPWEETEKILKEVIEKVGYTKDWTIWEL